jgi:hypothetical protein
MKHTEQYCKDLLKKVIKDLERQRGEEYYDKKAPFEAYFHKDEKNLFDQSIIKNCWIVKAKVPKDGWKGGFIIIDVDDDTGKALTFVNTALGGRPITLPLKTDNEGKYYIDPDYLPNGE